MFGLGTGEGYLENGMVRLMDAVTKENANPEDTMILLSLVNLLGIVSVLNKQELSAVSAPRSTGENPMMSVLLNMLGSQQGQQSHAGNQFPLDPALLLSLLGPQSQRPESALLLALLGKMMQASPPPPPVPERQKPVKMEQGEVVSKSATRNRSESNRPGTVLNWGGGRWIK